jgi:RHS repeat-associated protein
MTAQSIVPNAIIFNRPITQWLNDPIIIFFVYSSSGELQKKMAGSDTTSYAYDYFGNLITVILPNNDRIDYIIDGQNRRIGKKLNGQIVKKWIYSGQLSPSAELDSAGNVIAQFVGPLTIKNGHGYQLVTDHLGSVRVVVDVSSGDVVQKLEYDEYGNVISDSNPDFEPFGYAGGLYDSQTKLVRFGARDYNASVGRWTRKDPIRFGGGASNVYEYVGNDPGNNKDYSGLWSTEAHNEILRRALGNKVSADALSILQYSSLHMDTDNPFFGDAYKHSMRNIGESAADAIRERENFIHEKLVQAKKCSKAGKRGEALELLGQALHTIMDSSSPLHINPDGTPRLWPSGYAFQHGDIGEGVEQITIPIQMSQNYLINGAYNYVFGN